MRLEYKHVVVFYRPEGMSRWEAEDRAERMIYAIMAACTTLPGHISCTHRRLETHGNVIEVWFRQTIDEDTPPKGVQDDDEGMVYTD